MCGERGRELLSEWVGVRDGELLVGESLADVHGAEGESWGGREKRGSWGFDGCFGGFDGWVVDDLRTAIGPCI